MPQKASTALFAVQVPEDPNIIYIRERLNRGQMMIVGDAEISSKSGGGKNLLAALWDVYVAKWEGPDFAGMECTSANWDTFDSNPLFDKVDAEILKRLRAQNANAKDAPEAKNG